MVSVDNVYQKVLALANKEQRGYITPQEFNLFANQAQMEIFEQYFYDEEQFERRVGSDIVELLDQKMQIFKTMSIVTHGTLIPENTHQIDYSFLHDSASEQRRRVERVHGRQVANIKSGSLLNNLSYVPVFYVRENKIHFHPVHAGGSANNTFTYRIAAIRKPIKPNWTYVIDPTTQNALYNPNASDHQNFELHVSEESKLVIKILQLAGVNMKDPNLVQLTAQKEVGMIQQQKQ